ncbi:hypothetical protein FOG18_03470 [Legionella israelensis]|uniref:hypothetical protein n=1 Tax=Legionella israelensis TaxID=454 RepID=UPI001180E28C|nr:hypothetical protein [Legionella israelensis]QDP71696.1 hypothetical protein FOG18_03470 [Legionella israelensis]
MNAQTQVIIPDFILSDEEMRQYRPQHENEFFQKHVKYKKQRAEDEEAEKLRISLLSSLEYYLNILQKCNPAMFKYMSNDELYQLFQDLHHAYLLLVAKYQHDLSLGKKEQLKEIKQQQRHCLRLLKALQSELYDTDSIPVEYLQEEPVKYCGIPFARWFVEKIHQFSTGKTKVIKEWMGDINEKRLYWVWGGGLLKTVLDSLPDEFFNNHQAKQETSALSPYIGALGWILYYARFFINLGLLLKHTIRGPWMSEEEKSTPWTKRLSMQWQQRKFALLNDSIWATANLVCYFWLVGPGVKGHAGDALTILLLAMDLGLSIWRYKESKAQFKKELTALEANRQALMDKLSLLEEQEEINRINIQIRQMDKAIAKCKSDWKYKQISLINDISYALALMVSFAVLSAPFLPFAAPVLMTMAIVGTVACFALTVIYSAISAGVEVAKANHAKNEAKEELRLLLAQYETEEDKNIKKRLYLEMKDLMAETEYQKKVCRYQAICMVRSVLIDAMVPVVVFAATVFMPLGVGLAIMGAALVVGLLSKVIIDKLAKPKEAEKSEFNEEEYKRFNNAPSLEALKPEAPSKTSLLSGLFSKKKGNEAKETEGKPGINEDVVLAH